MSSHAWLDSLSEDWPSEPESPQHSKPPSQNVSTPSSVKATGTKIPRPRSSQGAAQRKLVTTPGRNSSAVLNERTPSDINIPASSQNRNPFKLSYQEGRESWRSHRSSRSFNIESPAGSIIHNTVNHRSTSSSPGKSKGNTPEWKRRLIYGELAYGEQRDLFTSAATGLEGMFKPPVPSRSSLAQSGVGEEGQLPQNETSFTSSPPGYAHEYSNYETYGDGSSEELQQPPLPESRPTQRGIQYRLNDDEDMDASENSDMSIRRQPIQAATVESALQSPSPKALRVRNDGLRKTSNQSAARHEDFSAILIGRQNGENDDIDFAPIDVSPEELHERLQKIQESMDQKSFDAAASPDASKISNAYATEFLKPIGSSFNIRRGVELSDDSFRQLRAASGVGNTSEALSEGSLQASTPKKFPSVRIHGPDGQLSPPRTPSSSAAAYLSPVKRDIRAPGSGPSPLKLFGAYDTFTNDILSKRIRDANNPSTQAPAWEESKDAAQQVEDSIEPSPNIPSSSKKMTPQNPGPRKPATRSFSKFGAGELDGYVFNEAFSFVSNEPGDGSVMHHSPSLRHKESSSPEVGEDIVVKKRHQKAKSASPAPLGARSPRSLSREMAAHAISLIATPTQHELLEYKRPRTSPSKDPTPKRRRTLHESDVAFGAEDDEFLDLLHASLQQLQLPTGIKRKNIRLVHQLHTANARILASRHFLRPQSPTPKQKLSPRSEVGTLAEHDDFEAEFSKSTQKILQQAHKLNLAATAQRKPSIKTEDFLNEAHRIMAAIRGRSGLPSGLTSVEESDEEHVKPIETKNVNTGDAEESTREPFSRPPSREGKPVPRVTKRQEDPDLVNHLKQYEENSDLGDIHIIASSLKSLGISKKDIQAVQALEQQHSHSSMSETSENGVLGGKFTMSDPPNIRISENPNRYRYSTAAEEVRHFRSRLVSNGSGSESGYSTAFSILTGSSRNSEPWRIAPESVSHLIPDQVGSMVFDHQRKIWRKTKRAQTARHKRSNTLLSENSEDDVFAGIPDLTVDVSKELQNLRAKMAQQGDASMQSVHQDDFAAKQVQHGQGGTLKSILVKDFADRAKNGTMRSPSKIMRQFVEDDDEDVEHEINIQEDRLDETSPRRRGTVVFSSPISTVIQDMAAAGAHEEQASSPLEESFTGAAPLPAQRKRRNVSFQATNIQAIPRSRKSSHVTARRMSVKEKSFVPRAVSVIEEQDEDTSGGKADITKELSIFGDQSLAEQTPSKSKRRQTSLNIVVSTSAHEASQLQIDNADTLGHYVGNLSLSPMSDFTAHPEQSYAFEVSYVVGDQHLVTGDGTQKRMPQTVRQLVDKIAEVEEFEPFWEDMKEIELRDKRLGSLHMLDKFCGSLVRVDVSQNLLRALDGIPATVRELKISNNLLSDLSAWNRLANLQVVDVSNNNIKSLSSFRNLVHLRELVADNTSLTSLSGIKYHDSLIRLRAKGNAITELDFDGTRLQKLQTLDLEDNNIQSIENLDQLESLSYLNLKGNQLVGFCPKKPVPLKQLNISDNKLRALDLAMLTRLHLVYADRNKLATVLGLDRVPHLDSLSLREQRGSKAFDMSTLGSAYEVRKLFLSGNRLGDFVPPQSFLNLQLLDLAHCALQRLPDSVGDSMPNLRVLNLNFNGLSDISGLQSLSRLKRLHLVGNRFTDFKPLVNVLAGLPWLTELDLRNNIVTQGFYPPIHLAAQKKESNGTPADPFRLPEADTLRDAKFCRLLDMDTRIERRIYERKVVRACEQLQRLDGLPVNKKVRHIKDIVWKTMVERGLLLRPDGSVFDLSNIELEDEGLSSMFTEHQGAARDESRWGAEDSFA